MKPQKVSEVIDFVGEYISTTIKRGSLETVCIPYFGKFEAKLRQAGIIDQLTGLRKAGAPMIEIDKTPPTP